MWKPCCAAKEGGGGQEEANRITITHAAHTLQFRFKKAEEKTDHRRTEKGPHGNFPSPFLAGGGL